MQIWDAGIEWAAFTSMKLKMLIDIQISSLVL